MSDDVELNIGLVAIEMRPREVDFRGVPVSSGRGSAGQSGKLREAVIESSHRGTGRRLGARGQSRRRRTGDRDPARARCGGAAPADGLSVARSNPRPTRMTKTRDVVDIAAGTWLRTEIAGDMIEEVRRWSSARPLGDLWVAADGAVGGYVEGQERLLGYTVEDPAGEIARGFLVWTFFDIRDKRLVDIDSGAMLGDTVGAECVEQVREIEDAVVTAMGPGGTIRETNCGDVLYLVESGPSRIAAANPKSWFPGHLGLESTSR